MCDATVLIIKHTITEQQQNASPTVPVQDFELGAFELNHHRTQLVGLEHGLLQGGKALAVEGQISVREVQACDLR